MHPTRRLFLQMSAAAVPGLAGETEPVYVTDLSRCLPASALSDRPRHGHWRLLAYETDQFQGRMLVAGQNTAAPEISLPVSQKGWYAIYFGLRSYGGGEDLTRLQVRLQSDPAFSLIAHTEGQPDRIDEYLWKTANLTGDPILLRQLELQTVPENSRSRGNEANGVWLAYVKLVPLTEPQVRELEADRS